jgi:hypothetical protein
MIAPKPRYMIISNRAIHKYDTATQAITILAGSTVLAGSVDSWDASSRVDGSLASARFAQLEKLCLDGRGGEWDVVEKRGRAASQAPPHSANLVATQHCGSLQLDHLTILLACETILPAVCVLSLASMLGGKRGSNKAFQKPIFLPVLAPSRPVGRGRLLDQHCHTPRGPGGGHLGDDYCRCAGRASSLISQPYRHPFPLPSHPTSSPPHILPPPLAPFSQHALLPAHPSSSTPADCQHGWVGPLSAAVAPKH